MRNKLFKRVLVGGVMQDPVPMKKWFDHCLHNWADWIKEDAKSGGPLSGTVDNLIGAPSEDSAEWKNWLEKAGDDEGPDTGDDAEFHGNGGVDEGEIVDDGSLAGHIPTGDSDDF